MERPRVVPNEANEKELKKEVGDGREVIDEKRHSQATIVSDGNGGFVIATGDHQAERYPITSQDVVTKINNTNFIEHGSF